MKTYKDVYKFPLQWPEPDWGQQVYDADMNWVFDFMINRRQINLHHLDIINGIKREKPVFLYEYDLKNTRIVEKLTKTPIIDIRGWGNLTGRMQLTVAEAANIQDTFAQFVVNQLNGVKDGNIKP